MQQSQNTKKLISDDFVTVKTTLTSLATEPKQTGSDSDILQQARIANLMRSRELSLTIQELHAYHFAIKAVSSRSAFVFQSSGTKIIVEAGANDELKISAYEKGTFRRVSSMTEAAIRAYLKGKSLLAIPRADRKPEPNTAQLGEVTERVLLNPIQHAANSDANEAVVTLPVLAQPEILILMEADLLAVDEINFHMVLPGIAGLQVRHDEEFCDVIAANESAFEMPRASVEHSETAYPVTFDSLQASLPFENQCEESSFRAAVATRTLLLTTLTLLTPAHLARMAGFSCNWDVSYLGANEEHAFAPVQNTTLEMPIELHTQNADALDTDFASEHFLMAAPANDEMLTYSWSVQNGGNSCYIEERDNIEATLAQLCTLLPEAQLSLPLIAISETPSATETVLENPEELREIGLRISALIDRLSQGYTVTDVRKGFDELNAIEKSIPGVLTGLAIPRFEDACRACFERIVGGKNCFIDDLDESLVELGKAAGLSDDAIQSRLSDKALSLFVTGLSPQAGKPLKKSRAEKIRRFGQLITRKAMTISRHYTDARSLATTIYEHEAVRTPKPLRDPEMIKLYFGLVDWLSKD